MNVKKALPVILLVVLAVITLVIKRSSNHLPVTLRSKRQAEERFPSKTGQQAGTSVALDRNATNLFYTKHAKCRMRCRHITQQEVKDILISGTINYSKSDLNDPRGATYAVEGMTGDNQHVRIIFSPKKEHLTVVTVIDLEVEYECDCS